jgi:hypothetical protein
MRMAIPNVTFLPMATPDPNQAYKLNLRNMLPDPAFAEAIQNVPADGRPASAAAVMGPYYPRAAFCSIATLAASGPPACLEGWQLPAAAAAGSPNSFGACSAETDFPLPKAELPMEPFANTGSSATRC